MRGTRDGNKADERAQLHPAQGEEKRGGTELGRGGGRNGNEGRRRRGILTENAPRCPFLPRGAAHSGGGITPLLASSARVFSNSPVPPHLPSRFLPLVSRLSLRPSPPFHPTWLPLSSGETTARTGGSSVPDRQSAIFFRSAPRPSPLPSSIRRKRAEAGGGLSR